MPQLPPSRLLLQPPCAKRSRVSHVTAIFSEAWNRPFCPRDARSRRRRFLQSGERISGFTAIFCDDWKDHVDEDEDEDEDIDEPGSPSKRAIRNNVNGFARPWSSSPSRCKRPRRESPAGSLSAISLESQLSWSTPSPPRSLLFTATPPESSLSLCITSPEPEDYRGDEFESQEWPSPGDSDSNVTSFLLDSDEHFSTLGIKSPRGPFLEVSTLGQPKDLGIALLEEEDRNLYLALMSDEAEDSSKPVTTTLNFETRKIHGIFHSSKAFSSQQQTQDNSCEVEPEGFEFWDDFIKRCMGVHSCHDVEEDSDGSNVSKEPRSIYALKK